MIFGMNFIVFCLVVLVIVLYYSHEARQEGTYLSQLPSIKEGFGMSPGTMDQLHSTSVQRPILVDVNARPDQELDDDIQERLTRKALLDMTESAYDGGNYAPA